MSPDSSFMKSVYAAFLLASAADWIGCLGGCAAEGTNMGTLKCRTVSVCKSHDE